MPKRPAHREQRDQAWRRSRSLPTWIAVLFMVGSACFAVGSVPGFASAVSDKADAIVFFVGSVFFTSAGYLQYAQSVAAGDEHRPGPVFRAFGLQPRRFDWWSSTVQFVGTLCFNVSTFAAIHVAWNSVHADTRVWTPDMVGSVCFLVASQFAILDVSGRWWCWRHDGRGWDVALINMAGSILFMVSAVASFVFPATGDFLNTGLMNLGTCLGAICFFVAAWLLLEEPEEAAPAEAAPAEPRLGT